jgi:hypothetical protein
VLLPPDLNWLHLLQSHRHVMLVVLAIELNWLILKSLHDSANRCAHGCNPFIGRWGCVTPVARLLLREHRT